MKKSKNNGARRLKKRELQQKIMEFLLKQNKQSFNYKQIAFAIEATLSLIHISEPTRPY